MKRFLCILLALMVAASFCCATALAATDSPDELVEPDPEDAYTAETGEASRSDDDTKDTDKPDTLVTASGEVAPRDNADANYQGKKIEFLYAIDDDGDLVRTVYDGSKFSLVFLCEDKDLEWKDSYKSEDAEVKYGSNNNKLVRRDGEKITVVMEPINDSKSTDGTRFIINVPVECKGYPMVVDLSLKFTGTGGTTSGSVSALNVADEKNHENALVYSKGGTPPEQDRQAPIYRYLGSMNDKGKELRTITKGSKPTLQFLIIDPNIEYNSLTKKAAEATFYATYSSTHLKPRVDENITFTVEDSTRYSLNSADPNRTPSNLAFVIDVPVTYDGVANPDIRIDYSFGNDTTNILAYKSDHFSLDIPNYKEKDTSKDDDDDDEKTPLTPYIIVSNYSYGGNSVTAGNDFFLDLTLENTSSDCDLENIVMNLRPQGVFSVASSSNTVYLDRLEAEGKVDQRILINAGMTKLTEDKDSNTINISFEYEYYVDKRLNKGSSDESITIPVIYPDRFELGMIEMPSNAFAGEEYEMYIPMVNKGRSGVYNVSASVKCEGANPVQNQFIGNLNAGTETGADFRIVFPAGGEYQGEILVTYEDANMAERSVSQPFTVSVTGYEDMNYTEEDFPEDIPEDLPPETPAGFLSRFTRNQKIGAAVGCALLAGALILIIRNRKRAKELKELMDDEEI